MSLTKKLCNYRKDLNMKTTEAQLKPIPLDELIATTTHPFDTKFLSDSVSKVVSVKKRLNTLYLSLNTGGISLPFNVIWIGILIENAVRSVGAKKLGETIELTLLSDKGVEWLNQVNSIVKEARIVTRGIVEEIETDKTVEELLKQWMDEYESELVYED